MFWRAPKSRDSLSLQKKNNFKPSTAVIMAAVFLLILVSSAALLYWEDNRPAALLNKALQNMEKRKELQVKIEEEGKGYNLSFKGIIVDERLIGEIPEYSLHILYRQSPGELYVKDLKEEQWKKAAELDLDELKTFLSSPLKALKSPSIEGSSFVENKQSRKEGGEKEKKVVKLYIPQKELDHKLNPGSELYCSVHINQEEEFISKIYYDLKDPDSGKAVLERTYHFE